MLQEMIVDALNDEIYATESEYTWVANANLTGTISLVAGININNLTIESFEII